MPMKGVEPRIPHPMNAPGLFYVESGSCISCRVAERDSPELIGHVDGPIYHCYFKSQPSNPEQEDRAISACVVSCCGALRYAGSDSSVFKRMLDRGGILQARSCDALATLSESQIRGRVAKLVELEDSRSDPLWDSEVDGEKPAG